MQEPTSNNNVINNYKGVMLCSRPNQAQGTTVQKPFCARVVPRDQLGLVPTKEDKVVQYEIKKPKLQILDRHKKWLNQFKKNVKVRSDQIEQMKKQEQQKFNRIKQQAQADRQRSKKMKYQYNQTASNVLNILDSDQAPVITSNELTPANLNKLNQINEIKSRQQGKNSEEAGLFQKKKKSSNLKPLWAQTQQQVQKHQDQQVDELLGFFQSNHVQDYAQDDQVKNILGNLKEKIQKLKQQQDWKQKQMSKIKHKRQAAEKADEEEDDKYSNYSVQSNSQSISSQKTQKKIEELKAKKKQQQEWDKFTTSQKSSLSNIDDKIAKNIADQVLRNYPNLKGVHSNVSIRRLLEQEAAKVINQPICRPVITTVVREKNKIDANNLPYLHRNPAI